jgi:hypothetical protein
MKRLAVALACLGLLAARGARADADPREVFERYSPAVVQVRIEEIASEAKRSLGSGFFVEQPGLVVTNYHVISEVVHHPDRYRVRLTDAHGAMHDARIVTLDVVHDLSVLRTDAEAPRKLAVYREGATRLAKGERLFSLGNPLDLGMSVVEGTYNGLLEHSRYERIHFTGSLNPGMSGGPAMLGDGRVVGVNVATAGEQVSFLVPAAPLAALLERAAGMGDVEPSALRETLRTQLVAHQREYLGELVAKPFPTVRLGHFNAPTQLAPFFNCWGDRIEHDEDLYEGHAHGCSTDDYVFVSDARAFSIVEIAHRQLSSAILSPSRFAALYSNWFETNHSMRLGRKEDFTQFRCRNRFVENGNGLTFKASFCARRYRDLEGLYDVIFKTAVVGKDREGLETALMLSAVELDSARKLAQHVLESISWSE